MAQAAEKPKAVRGPAACHRQPNTIDAGSNNGPAVTLSHPYAAAATALPSCFRASHQTYWLPSLR